MTAKELEQKFLKLNAQVASLKMQFLQAKHNGEDRSIQLEIRGKLRATEKERNYYRTQYKLAKKAESIKE